MAFTVDKAFELISSAHERERLAHAFLITGPKGSGKEELAARMGELLNGKGDGGSDLWGEPVEKKAPTLAELEGEFIRAVRPRSKSRRIAVDDIRDLEKMMHQSSPGGTWKLNPLPPSLRSKGDLKALTPKANSCSSMPDIHFFQIATVDFGSFRSLWRADCSLACGLLRELR